MPKKKDSIKKSAVAQRKSTARRERMAKQKAYFTYLTTTLFVVGFLVGFGYYLGLKTATEHRAELSAVKPSKVFDGVKTHAVPQVSYDEAGLDIIGRLIKEQEARSKQRREAQKPPPKPVVTPQRPSSGTKPKLLIIIDDVSQAWQIKAIKKLGYPVTPSIFPPSEMGRHSNRLAQNLTHFMIHLPMESGNAKLNHMRGMLFVRDSAAKMKARAREIRRLFPNGRFINNHTGSVFTANYKAMKRMYGYLRDEGFTFIDSRTSGKTKVRKIAHAFGDRYIVRDVFIDNTKSVPYIHKQLAKAVRIAKRKGSAIAIGHPHKATLKALRSAKKLFKGVDLLYIDELY